MHMKINILLVAFVVLVVAVTDARYVRSYKDLFERLLREREADVQQSYFVRDNKIPSYRNKRLYNDIDYEENSNDVRSVRENQLRNLLSDIVKYGKEKRGSIEEENFVDTIESDPEPVIQKHNLKMPDVAPEKPDTYLCYAYELPKDDVYITKFEPDADMSVAHHMLLFGCKTPFKYDKPWQCREMQPVCESGTQSIKYAWGKNAPALTMPKDVAFHVGGNAPVKYLVLQVHYLHVDAFKDGKTKDRSGLVFTTTDQKPKYYAGIQLLAAGWPPIPPHVEKFHMDMNCLYQNNNGMKFFPFRFRVHAHKLGSVITGYRVRDGVATLIGRGDPQRAQAFYKVNSDLAIQNDDLLIGRCTFNSSTRESNTVIGATHNDEMCNFYMMYFHDSKFGDAGQLPCYPVNKKIEYPADSDVKLSEVEQKNSLVSHNNLVQKKLSEALRVCKENDIFKYTVVEHWPKGGNETGEIPISKKLPQLGQIAGVAVTAAHVIIFHRLNRAWDATTFDMHNSLTEKYQKPIAGDTLVWLDRRTGQFVKSGGAKMFYLPHGITVDKDGNIWLTDVGSHQVIKMTADGKILLTLGEKLVHGTDKEHFCKPTDVAVLVNGDFFVADGYCNSRVMKFNADGKFLFSITSKNTQTLTPPTMSVVHSLALEEKNDRLYVADRENKRVLVFSTKSGDYLSQVVLDQPAYAIAFEKTCGGVLHVVTEDYNGAGGALGYTFSVHSSHPLEMWKPPTGFNRAHDMAVSPDQREIYVTQIGPNKVWKFRNGRVRP